MSEAEDLKGQPDFDVEQSKIDALYYERMDQLMRDIKQRLEISDMQQFMSMLHIHRRKLQKILVVD